MSDIEEIQTMLDDCETRQGKLSDWEVNFISSLDDALAKYGRLTAPQETKLTEVWDRVTQ